MKKIVLNLFICLPLICLLFVIGVKAHAETGLAINSGASMRTAAEHQGLRFSASVSSLDGITEHGFYVIKGKHTKSEITSAIAASESTISGDKLLKKIVDGTDLDFHLVIYNIDSLSRYAQPITVLAYTYDGSSYEYTSVVTKNLADVARAEYNNNTTPADLVTTVAEAAKVKVTHDGGAVNYFGTLAAASAAFAEGDTVELVKGTYIDELTISVNDFSLKGACANVGLNSSGVRSDEIEETELTNPIKITNGVENVEINGLFFSGDSSMILEDAQTNIEFTYNKCTFTSNGIKDSRTGDKWAPVIHEQILIKNNYFHGGTATDQKDIYFQGYSNGVVIENNQFGDDLTTGQANVYCVKCNYITIGSEFVIKSNNFLTLNCNYVIDLGYSHSEKSKKGNIIIEDNYFSSGTSTPIKRNGIRICNLADVAKVKIIRNRRFVVNNYYNAIFLSSAKTATSNAASPDILIAYNLCYSNAMKTKPTDRTALEGDELNAFKVVLGINTTSNVIFDMNYISSSKCFSTHGYDSNTQADASASTYVLDFSESGKVTNTYDDSNALYATFVAERSKVADYQDKIRSIDTGINAYYGGSGAADITTYISSFAPSDADIYGIQSGKLVYKTGSITSPTILSMLDEKEVSSVASLMP